MDAPLLLPSDRARLFHRHFVEALMRAQPSGTVFVYHNGAESYYAARAFRGSLGV
jgi:hypothetical protein